MRGMIHPGQHSYASQIIDPSFLRFKVVAFAILLNNYAHGIAEMFFFMPFLILDDELLELLGVLETIIQCWENPSSLTFPQSPPLLPLCFLQPRFSSNGYSPIRVGGFGLPNSLSIITFLMILTTFSSSFLFLFLHFLLPDLLH